MSFKFRDDVIHYIKAGFPAIWVTTHEEDRAETELAAAAETLKRRFHRWSVTCGWIEEKRGGVNPQASPSAQGTADPLAAVRQLIKLPEESVLVMRDFHPYIEDNQIIRVLKDAIPALKGTAKMLVFESCVTKIPPELEKEIVVLPFKLPTREQLDDVLGNVLKAVPKRVEIADRTRLLEAALGLTKAEAENAFALALVKHGSLLDAAMKTIQAEKAGAVRKSGLLEYFEPDVNLAGVGGLNGLKGFVEKRTKAFTDEAKKFGLPAPRGVLVLGVPGCGKSLSAKATAAHWRVPCLRADFGRIFGSLVGQSEENMRKMIALAEAIAPCVLWIDEIEKGLSGLQSSGVTDSGVTSRIFGTFLTWLSEKTAPVFVFATANDVSKIPPEFLRQGRFDEKFFVDLPTQTERAEIFKIHIAKRKRNPKEFEIGKLAMEADQFSGAEIEEAVVAAMYEAFDQGRDIKTEDVLQVIANTKPLAVTLAEKITAIRDWSKDRTRPATSVLAEPIKQPVRRLTQ